MDIRLTFCLTLTSDYHIGSGHGLGAGIDSALHRDSDGVEVIRGTVLTGLLRDSLWRLMRPVTAINPALELCESGLQGTTDRVAYCGQFRSATSCPACRLFGNPVWPKHWRISTARPADCRKIRVAGGSPLERKIVQRASIDLKTRRAEEHKLFSQETGAAGTDFLFSITCRGYDESILDEAALWTAVVRNLRQLGQSRRRGMGECLVQLSGVEIESVPGTLPNQVNTPQEWLEYFLNRFQSSWLEDSLPPPPVRQFITVTSASTGEESLKRIKIITRTEEPLLIARRAEAGNQFESTGYIPGQTMRGAFAWLAAGRCDVHNDDIARNMFIRMFQRDRVHFPMLYPAVAERPSSLYPSIPAPLDMVTCKTAPGMKDGDLSRRGFGHGVWFGCRENTLHKCNVCASPLTGESGFVVVDKDRWKENLYHHETVLNTEMHIRVDPNTGVVREGDLYGYVPVPSGCFFIGELVCRESEWEELCRMTGITLDEEFTLRLGRSTNRGYGRVTMWLEDNRDNVSPGYGIEPGKRLNPLTSSNEVILTHMSPVIIQDTWGRFATGFSREWLQKKLDLPIRKIVSPVSRTVAVDGFNSYLGLARWRDMALAAGSAVRLILEGPPDVDKLQALELHGIGLRRGEGFGRIVFNHPVYTHCMDVDGYLSLNASQPLEQRLPDLGGIRRDWQDTVHKEVARKKFGPPPLVETVARIILANRFCTPVELREKIEAAARPGNNLSDLMGQYRAVGKHARDRYKERQQCVEKLIGFMDKLPDEKPAFIPEGLQIFAEALSAQAAINNEE